MHSAIMYFTINFHSLIKDSVRNEVILYEYRRKATSKKIDTVKRI